MRELAEQELATLEERQEALLAEVKVLLLPTDPNDEKNVMLEIRAGTGGDEAGLFAADLFRMYTRFAERQGWKVEVLSSHETGMGAIKEVIALIQGQRVYSQLKYESGVHRVQRVPATEASGRIHTSTATVAVLPEAEEVDITIDPKALRIDTFCSSGPGGQSVNTTYSAVRITHIPTGLVVSQQDEKSQIKNKAKGMKVLRSRLYELEMRRQQAEIAQDRRSQVGTGERSEKIRTYNFPQSRITDHRIGFTTHQLPAVLDGELDQLIDAVVTHFQSEDLKALRDGFGMRLIEHVNAARDQLASAGLAAADAAFDAEVLARHALGWDRATYLSGRGDRPPESFAARYGAFVTRRARREPVSCIVGVREFWGLDFELTRDVLMPRPDSELIVEEALSLVAATPDANRWTIVDVGTGSGCLAVSLACGLPEARVVATDVSADALAVARRNADRHNVADRVHFVRTRFFDGLNAAPDLIVANMPYVPTLAVDQLAPEVRSWEPRVALDGGGDGLDLIRELAVRAERQLTPGTHLILEFGLGQDDELRHLIDQREGLELIKLRADLQEIPRTAVIRRTPNREPRT